MTNPYTHPDAVTPADREYEADNTMQDNWTVLVEATTDVAETLRARVAELSEECERERMRLAACGAAALGYFNGCADEYKSASLDDVLSLRKERDRLEASQRSAWNAAADRDEKLEAAHAHNAQLREALEFDGFTPTDEYHLKLVIAALATTPDTSALDALRKDAERLKAIRDLCGYVEDGSAGVLKIFQDDATKDWFVKVGNTRIACGRSFNAAIDAAMKGERDEPQAT